MSHSRTSPKVAQGRPGSPGEVGRRSPGKRTSPVGGAFPGRPCLGGQAKGPSQDQLGDLSARQLALFSGPPAEPRSGTSNDGGQAGGAGVEYDGAGSRIDPVDVTYLTNRAPAESTSFDHVWYWGRPSKALPPYEPQRKGRRCRVRCRGRGGGPLNVAVEMADGELVVAPRWAVRRAR
jgi:hypothetical protein